ncbi:MAG: hypothetical protein E3K29_06870 [Candidatus Brocadia sp.]|nr:hypothetical protein [Candidatus Brocadia sp.]
MNIVYLFEFDFSIIKDITGFADAGGGNTTVTCVAHGLSNGNSCSILGTDAFDGTFTISNVAADSFRIARAYVAGDTMGYLDIPQPVYICTAAQNIVYDSKTWNGVGGNMAFDKVSSTSDLSSYGVNITLSGVDRSIIALVLQKKYVGRVCKMYLMQYKDDGTIDGTPLLLFWGLINGGFRISEDLTNDVPTCTVVARMTDRLGEIEVITGVQTNIASHQRISPGDMFFRNVPGLRTKEIQLKQKMKK